jgi:hypothetical protein
LQAPGEKIEWYRFSGKIKLNGMQLGTFRQKIQGGSDDTMEIDIIVPTTTALFLVPRLKKAKTIRLDLESLYEAESNNMLYRIPYHFETTDLKIPWKN